MRPLLSALAALAVTLAAALPARAGDTASLEILGFSADGGIFAFEQYGVQEWLRAFLMPSASTSTSTMTAGCPARRSACGLEDETASLDAARQQARSQGNANHPRRGTGREPRRHRRHGARSPNCRPTRTAMEVNPRPVFPPVDDPLEFRVEEIAVSPPENCEGLGWDIHGFPPHPHRRSPPAAPPSSSTRTAPACHRAAAARSATASAPSRPSSRKAPAPPTPRSLPSALLASKARIIAGWPSSDGCRATVARHCELRPHLLGSHASSARHPGQTMIPRYSRPEMAAIWSPETKFRIWFEIEAHACDALAELGVIPKEAARTIWDKGGPATFRRRAHR